MRRVLAAAFIIVVQGAILNATDWSTVVIGLDKSVVRLEILPPDATSPGVCSGVVLNAYAGFVLTAAHCTEEKASYTVNGRHAELVRQNKLLDLAVLRTELKDAKAMPLAKETPAVGSEVAVAGFAFASKRMMMQFGRVSVPLYDDGALILDLVVIGGDSGGPAINQLGELVGMTSAVKLSHPSMHVGLLVPIEKIRDFADQYLERK